MGIFNESCVLSPDAMVQFESDTDVAAPGSCPAEFSVRVQADAPPRCIEVQQTSVAIVHGCYGNKKNVCREHGGLPSELTASLDELTTCLCKLIDTLPKDAILARRTWHVLTMLTMPAVARTAWLCYYKTYG